MRRILPVQSSFGSFHCLFRSYRKENKLFRNTLLPKQYRVLNRRFKPDLKLKKELEESESPLGKDKKVPFLDQKSYSHHFLRLKTLSEGPMNKEKEEKFFNLLNFVFIQISKEASKLRYKQIIIGSQRVFELLIPDSTLIHPSKKPILVGVLAICKQVFRRELQDAKIKGVSFELAERFGRFAKSVVRYESFLADSELNLLIYELLIRVFSFYLSKDERELLSSEQNNKTKGVLRQIALINTALLESEFLKGKTKESFNTIGCFFSDFLGLAPNKAIDCDKLQESFFEILRKFSDFFGVYEMASIAQILSFSHLKFRRDVIKSFAEKIERKMVEKNKLEILDIKGIVKLKKICENWTGFSFIANIDAIIFKILESSPEEKYSLSIITMIIFSSTDEMQEFFLQFVIVNGHRIVIRQNIQDFLSLQYFLKSINQNLFEYTLTFHPWISDILLRCFFTNEFVNKKRSEVPFPPSKETTLSKVFEDSGPSFEEVAIGVLKEFITMNGIISKFFLLNQEQIAKSILVYMEFLMLIINTPFLLKPKNYIIITKIIIKIFEQNKEIFQKSHTKESQNKWEELQQLIAVTSRNLISRINQCQHKLGFVNYLTIKMNVLWILSQLLERKSLFDDYKSIMDEFNANEEWWSITFSFEDICRVVSLMDKVWHSSSDMGTFLNVIVKNVETICEDWTIEELDEFLEVLLDSLDLANLVKKRFLVIIEKQLFKKIFNHPVMVKNCNNISKLSSDFNLLLNILTKLDIMHPTSIDRFILVEDSIRNFFKEIYDVHPEELAVRNNLKFLLQKITTLLFVSAKISGFSFGLFQYIVGYYEKWGIILFQKVLHERYFQKILVLFCRSYYQACIHQFLGSKLFIEEQKTLEKIIVWLLSIGFENLTFSNDSYFGLLSFVCRAVVVMPPKRKNMEFFVKCIREVLKNPGKLKSFAIKTNTELLLAKNNMGTIQNFRFILRSLQIEGWANQIKISKEELETLKQHLSLLKFVETKERFKFSRFQMNVRVRFIEIFGEETYVENMDIADYNVDFLFPATKIIFEVLGEIHYKKQGRKIWIFNDQMQKFRTLNHLGYKVRTITQTTWNYIENNHQQLQEIYQKLLDPNDEEKLKIY